MIWIQHVTILDLLLKGLVIGIVASAPMGPVGVLCLQRTLNKGRWYGFVTGVGAALSDIIYALITGYGMSFMDGFLTRNQTLLQIMGSLMLLGFGIFTFRSNPVRSLRPTDPNKKHGSYFRNFITSFLVTLSNPLIIFLFIGLFAQFKFVMPYHHWISQTCGFIGITGGAILWWSMLTYFVDKIRRSFNLRGIWVMNKVIGGFVILIALAGVIYTLTGNSVY